MVAFVSFAIKAVLVFVQHVFALILNTVEVDMAVLLSTLHGTVGTSLHPV